MIDFNIILLYMVLVCPLGVFCHGMKNYGPHGETDHVHTKETPCDVCPRYGRCVPKVQCPAHVRPASYNPSCHLDGDHIGVCCFTGSGHAAESERTSRASVSINVDDVKISHNRSRHKLKEWLARSEKLLERSSDTVVNTSAPSFGHHLSMVTYDKRADSLGRGALMNLFAAQELRARDALSEEQLSLGFAEHTDGPFCPPTPSCPTPPSQFRSLGGECNNPSIPSWGAVNTGFERLLPPAYNDGVWEMRRSTIGITLPSGRAVSIALVLEGSHPSPTHNLMFMQFGQFVAHDISAGVVFGIGDGEGFLPLELQHWACAPIATDPQDPFFGHFRHTCLNFVRAQLAPASDCSVGYAKQMNGATHYPDLSHLYGSSPEKFGSLRGPGGLLNTFNDYGRELPPLTVREECLTAKDGAACFESGDNHGNQLISLTVLHTIWTREHNRIARVLTKLNPGWNEELVFLETRRIVQAEYQHIIFNEWLPLLLGPEIVQMFKLAPSAGYSSTYDPLVNPSLTAEFAAAAMRFGHSIVDGKIQIQSPHSHDVYETISIPEVMFQPSRMRLRRFLDQLLNGLSWQPMQNVDPFLTEGLTSYLFRGGNPYGIDLAAINIQRGRDYGLRSYNDYRRLCGLPPFVDFSQFPPRAAQRLASVYNSPKDIDLWVGGLLEEPVDGGILGPTFAHIIADQFSRLKIGDRYFYEYGSDVNPGAFTSSQLAEIKKVTLSRIICDNRDGIELMAQPPDALLRADLPGNAPVPCESTLIPAMNLIKFKEQ
ncbi:hypothetical protein O3G_MSEX005394 [Manduca sexta]|uniref:Chorion peroxidase n=1 Tax=Manduca sexta TaxID=7130 RepID=A0A921YZW1_MANSE|nr:hypothetical protein O3G_MSEX005394 [Manduca sexta]